MIPRLVTRYADTVAAGASALSAAWQSPSQLSVEHSSSTNRRSISRVLTPSSRTSMRIALSRRARCRVSDVVRYLVDTDWVIHYFNGHHEIVARIQDLSSKGIGLSAISLAELFEGVFYSRDSRKSEEPLQDFLRGVELVGIDEDAARIFGRERGRLRAQGQTIGDFDLLIGATALPQPHDFDQQPAALRVDREAPNRLRLKPSRHATTERS